MMANPRSTAVLLLALLTACGDTRPPAAASGSEAQPVGGPRPVASADTAMTETHLFDTSDSTEVWAVPGRVGRGANGASCAEHGLELRKGTRRLRVPLFYTAGLPRERDGALFAKLSTDCVTGDLYRIDLTTGQPTKVEGRRR